MITKINIKKKRLRCIQLTSISFIICQLLFGVACSDKWDEHFQIEQASDETLWAAIGKQSGLSNFMRVIEACGYNEHLDGSQVFTVFAPSDDYFTKEDADALIARYLEQKQSGVRTEDNEVVKQFLQNHIALYNQSVSSLTIDTIKLMNGKYMTLTGNKFGQSNIVAKNQFCSNGVLFVLDRPQSYDVNVMEYLRKDGDLDSLANFLYSYDVYEFDASASVIGGEVKNGKVVYLDSVFRLTNSLINEYGYINREDSNYLMLVPTDRIWKRLYDEYIDYFNYPTTTARRDSMIRTMTHHAIARGTVFNLNQQPSLSDSALSTTYERNYRNVYSYNEPRYYKYQTPYANGGVFSGAQEVKCSNGVVLKQDEWKIDKRQTFLQQIKIEAEQSRYVDTVMFAHEPIALRQVPVNNPFYGSVSNNYFVEVQPIAAGSTTTVRYRIPDFLSNIGYDIYAVCVPAIAYNEQALPEDTLPNRLNFRIAYMQQDGTLCKEIALKNPADNSTNYITRPNVIDTVLVASNYKFETCAYGIETDNPMATLRIASSYISNKESSTYTRVLRIDCIILRAHQEE